MMKTKKKDLNWMEACRLSRTGEAIRTDGDRTIIVDEDGSGHLYTKSGYAKRLCHHWWNDYVKGKTDFKPA